MGELGSTMSNLKRWLPALGAVVPLALLLVGCGQAALTAQPPATSGLEGNVSVDFLGDNGGIVGRVFVRAGKSNPDGYIPFFVEVPIIPDQDYRLNSIALEFVSETIEPSILLEPSGDLLGRGIEFSTSGSTVRLLMPDTGRHSDGTILVRFLAVNTTFGERGLQLTTKLKFGKGIGEARLTINPVS